MHFARLRLSGFKSFVDPIEVAIERGLTGIVGPNGCGKSNLVEALRWAMGESSARRMRGQEMDDVIFGGTTARPPRNLAEVTIALDNADRTAPGWDHADTIEVSRRIERGLGSDFRINGRPARARDVQLVFQDNASGPASPALVSQGRVAALIAAKPAERRQILEEAAGTTGLHARRHEAELRLRSADENLRRLDDVIAALEVQLGGLRRQARQATRYRTLSEQIRRTEAVVLHLRWTAAVAAVAEARQAYDLNERVVGERTIAARRVEAERDAAVEALSPLRRADNEAAAALQRTLVAREALEAEAARLAEAGREAKRRLDQAEGDLVRERGLAAEAAQAIARLGEERARVEAASEGEAGAQAAAGTAAEDQRRSVDGLEGRLTRLTEAVAGDEARRQALARRRSELDARLSALTARLDDAVCQRAALETDAAQPRADTASALAAADAALEAARAAAEAGEARKGAADAALGPARDALQAAEAAATRLTAEADGLRAALGASKPGRYPPVLDELRVAPGYEAALGAALGEDAAAALDPAAPAHWRDLPAYPEAAPLPEGVEQLAAHVEAPAALARRLAHVGLVADAAAGLAAMLELRPGQQLVGRDGGQWRWDGLAVAPGAPSPAAARLAQRNRLAALDRQIAEAGPASAAARARFEEARREAQEADAADKAARGSIQAAFAEAGRAREAHAKAEQVGAARRSRLAMLAESAERLAADRADAEQGRAALDAEAAALPDLADQRRELAELRAALAAARSDLAAKQAAAERLQREAGSRRTRLRAIEGEVETWQARAAGGRDRLAELDARAAESRATLSALESKPAEIALRRGELLTAADEAEHARRQAADALAVGEARQAAADRALRAAEAALAEAREARVRGEAAVVAAGAALDALRTRIAERLDCAPEAVAALAGLAPGDPVDEAAATARLDRLQREREGIGPVNLRAESEMGEVEAQLATLTHEKGDLVAAIAKLRHAISTLNREARERLLASFGTVDAEFRALFTRLFGGGRAHLELTETDDPLEAGLEIFASPPGKRLQHLSLLSGGEQALTALSLIFAVFLANPAPICVLDEVDAPLDDANVDRLCTLLEELGAVGRTRFLIITHHRMTMARVDRLYGVTMVERGVSQLVSVDLEGATRHAHPTQQEMAV